MGTYSFPGVCSSAVYTSYVYLPCARAAQRGCAAEELSQARQWEHRVDGGVFGDGRAQVDTASLGDSNMHGEAEKTEKQKARGYCVGAGVDICRRSASKVCAGNEASRDLCGA